MTAFRVHRRTTILAAVLTLLGAASQGAQLSGRPLRAFGTEDVVRAIAGIVNGGRHPRTSQLLSATERASLMTLYASGDFKPLWTDNRGHPTRNAREGIGALLDAGADGLDPLEYHAPALQAAIQDSARSSGSEDIANFDVTLSLSTLQYLQHVHHGRVDPRAIGFKIAVPVDVHDFPGELRQAVHDGRVGKTLAEAAPPLALYRSLRAMLAHYRLVVGAPRLQLPAHTVRSGDAFRHGQELLAKLRLLGDVPLLSAPAVEGIYDAVLTEGVRRFQVRHGLDPDGVLGPSTRSALDVPISWRVKQIELALERLRWLPHLGPDRVVAVNIPMFQLWAWNTSTPGSLPVLHMKAIVGRALSTQTPVFVDEMTDVTFRPYWNIPSSITRGEILPAIRRSANYLQQHNMEIVSNDPLRIRQRPGPRNALGLVKFEFPNDLNVYMHDTPAPQLFSRARRDFSHGCVRVSDPASLAEWALDAQEGWTRARIAEAMHGDQTRTVKLSRPIQVILFYITAVVTPDDGILHFASDIYRHDERLDRALTARTLH